MRIEEMYIGRFGKIEDRSIRFEPGLNVIYGENEAGKTTVQAFIKAMLYGFSAKRKSLRENERKRYFPWSGERAFGMLTFTDSDGTQYLIKRSFGAQKRQDEQVVLDCITGQEAVHIDFEKPGETLLGIGEEGFEKTICIKQLGSQIDCGKEDEIMQRLTNLQQTGDEDISYQKAVQTLLESKKKLENQRKTGKLDALRLHREKLREEYNKAVQRHEEMIEEEIQLKELEAQKSLLLQQIKELEEKKERIRKYKLYQEYKRLTEYQQKINELREEKKQLEQFLLRNGEIIQESFLTELQEQHSYMIQLKREIDAVESELQKLEEAIAEKQEALKALDAYKNLGEDEVNTLLKYHHESKLLQEQLEQMQKSEEELKELEKQLLEEERKLREICAAKEVEKDLEVQVYQARERLQTLKSEHAGREAQKQSLLLKKEMLEGKAKGIFLQIAVGIAVALAGGVAGWLQHLIFYGFSALAILWCLMRFHQKGKIAEEIREIQEALLHDEKGDSIKEEIEKLTQFLRQAYQVFGAEDFETFQKRAEAYRQQKEDFIRFRAKVEEKRAQRDEKEIERVQKKLCQQAQYIENILEACACRSVEEFSRCQKDYAQLVLEKENLEKQKEDLLTRRAEKQKELEKSEQKIAEQLEGLNIAAEAGKDLQAILKLLSEKMNQKKEIESEIDSFAGRYRAVLNDREEAAIREELENFIPDENDAALGDEKEVDRVFQQKHEELFALQDRIHELAHSIQRKEQEGKSVAQLEEELSEVNEAIQYGERRIQVFNAALEGLEEAFKEIQKDFGPKLNQKTGEILGRITRGKYTDLRISEDYQVRVTDPVQKEMREADYFSNGTWDQIYFALRLGIVQMIFENEKRPFLLLDDAFVQYDDRRLEAVWEYLHEYAKEHQVLLFTCHERDVQKARQYADVNLIRL
ncbi:MAG TPA: AAA family ATPase [Clostridiales bacterium]|nr:AAA family ATPase [Clostridiales bacterium]